MIDPLGAAQRYNGPACSQQSNASYQQIAADPLLTEKLQNVMAVTDVLALLWQERQTPERCDPGVGIMSRVSHGAVVPQENLGPPNWWPFSFQYRAYSLQLNTRYRSSSA
jgi:hypothetical protein